MGELPGHNESETGVSSELSTGSPVPPGTRRYLRPRIVIGVSIVVVLVALFVASGFAASSPRLCAMCHEMQSKVDTWKVSPHAEVGCYSCHATPRPWYGAPLSVVDSWRLLGRDVRAHWASRETTASSMATPTPIPDAACLKCHDPNRVATSRYGLVIKHAEHAKRNNSCVSCHLWSAHPDPKASRATLMMARCFNCHGKPDQPKASGECTVCHTKDIEFKPPTHTTGKWKTVHGQAAKADRQQCVMCHRQAFCDNCHGLEMPHPLGWARGASGHAAVAAKDRTVCAKCHEGNANLCTMCHHRGYDDKKGPWVKQHFAIVRETGAAYCFKCHESVFCVQCHTSVPAVDEPAK